VAAPVWNLLPQQFDSSLTNNYHHNHPNNLRKGNLTMPHFDDLPYPRRFNTLRLLGYDYTSTRKLCAITLVADFRRPVFADMPLAKEILTSLLSAETLANMHLRAFTLMPDHLHFLTGVRNSEFDVSDLIGKFKSFTTQLYWKRSHEILASGQVSLPSQNVSKSRGKESSELLSALSTGTATLRPEVVALKNWPRVRPENFVKKHLWRRDSSITSLEMTKTFGRISITLR
jgi:REP element-mobilizing transposase RayT